jgi:hypothetical protein
MTHLSELIAASEERLLIPTLVSAHPERWAALRNVLQLPLMMGGGARALLGGTPDGPVRVHCHGPAKRFAPLLQHLFQSVESLGRGPSGSRWRVPGEPHRADLTLVAVHPWAAPRFRRAGWTIVPSSVRWEGSLAQVPPPRPAKTLRSDLRRIRERGYVLEPARGLEEWTFFFERIVVAHARARFADEAWVPRAPFRRALMRRGHLLFVRCGSERVGGIAALPAGERVCIPLAGVLDGDADLRSAGVMAAAFGLGIEWARENGFSVIDLGRTTPYLADGTHAAKRKWGLEPRPDPSAHCVALRADPRRGAAQAAIAASPFYCETDRGLAIARAAGPTCSPEPTPSDSALVGLEI